MTLNSSTPTYWEFSPDRIPMQRQVIDLVEKEYDYNQGLLMLLLSGALGSSKSLVAAHLAVSHCLRFPGASVGLCRRALPDIKRTIYKKIKQHLGNESLEGYWRFIDTRGEIQFGNGSEIISISWADKNYEKVRSLELSAAIIEEATENKGDDMQGPKEVRERIRLSHVPERWMLWLTNPDSPGHWMYDYWHLEEDAE